MRFNFKRVVIHNFLSYGDAEIDLTNRNYCLVRGINNCPLDNAVSNGSGKSSWISAICWCLTGETVQGITNGIKNIFVEDNSCHVTVEFDVDNDSYIITRVKEPSPNLKIIKNGEDISGKGIRESQVILAQYLPDLNRKLLCSVILLGQGLPIRFTNNTPSGRKGVLEELSKSDFMIEDIKNRISERTSVLSSRMREVEDGGLKVVTLLNSLSSQLDSSKNELNSLLDESAYDVTISNTEVLIKSLENDMAEYKSIEDGCDLILNESYTKKSTLLSDYTTRKDEINTKYRKLFDESDDKISSLRVEISSLEKEISRIDSIKEVCPTCGRPFEGINKPDTSAMKEKLNSLKDELNSEMNNRKLNIQAPNDAELLRLKESYDSNVKLVDVEVATSKSKKEDASRTLRTLNAEYNKAVSTLAEAKASKESLTNRKQSIKAKIESLTKDISDNEIKLTDLQKSRDSIKQHLDVVKQMDTFVKRDFRGFLLSDIIEYVDAKAKEYCNDVFGTKELSFELNGNDIDIEYCGKDFSSLSGGEQQKVNIIIQFAIRNMLEKCLDFHSNILVLDEVYDNLDSIGVNNINNLIATKLNDIESVFIISHHADELQLPTDSELVITKDVNGISSVA